MVEWNRIFLLFLFSRILGQTREVTPKFQNEIPENVFSIRSPSRNFRNFGSNGKRSKCLETSGEYNLHELSYEYSFIFIITFLYNAPLDCLKQRAL